MKATVEELLDQLDTALVNVPFQRHLGLSIVRDDSAREPRVLMPSKPEAVGPDGSHSAAALFTVAEVAAGVRLGNELAPRVLELNMGAMFLTVSARVRPLEPAYGAIEATAELVKGFEEMETEGKPPRKATLEMLSRVKDESGATAVEQHTGFYVRFMEMSRMRALAPESSEMIRFLES